ncbi:MAG: hypothetical protein ACKO7C_04910 [Bacteroidota bacterium]
MHDACAQKEVHTFLNYKTKINSPELVLNQLHLSGYPYAHVTLDTVIEQKNENAYHWTVQLGNRIYCDSVLFNSDLLHQKTLYRMIHIAPGMIYNERDLKKIPQRINAISGVRMIQNPQIIFFEKSFQVRIPLERVKKNKLDGIMQLQNDPAQAKSIVTGNLDLELHNLLKRSESFHFLWKKPTTNSQYLLASMQLPYAFGLPIGMNADIQAFLRDSTFAQSQLKISTYGSARADDGLTVYLLKTNNVRFRDAAALGNTKSLLYGLQFGKRRGNLSALLPEKGFMFQIGGHTGQRKTISTNTNTIIYGYECTVQLHATNRNLFFQSKFLSAGTFGATFYGNEAQRIGGMNSIRGYFEESISAFHYALVQSNFGRRFGNSFSTYITTDFAQIIQPQDRQVGSFGIGTTLLQNNSSVALSFAWPFERGIAFEASNTRLGIQFNTYF